MSNGRPTITSLSTDLAVVQSKQDDMKEALRSINEKVDRPPIWFSLLLTASATLNGGLIVLTLSHTFR